MDVTGAAMKVARQPETGRHYPSDRCPVASDGKEREGKGKRVKGKGARSLRTGRRYTPTPYLALHRNSTSGSTQAATTAHARDHYQFKEYPTHQAQDSRL